MSEMILKGIGSSLIITYQKPIVTTQVEYDRCKFEFDSSWDGFVKTAVFYSDDNNKTHILLENDFCIIPWEVVKTGQEIMYIGVFGVNGDTVIPTNFVSVNLIEGAYGEGNLPLPPTQDVYTQVLAELAQIRETAVQQGNIATQQADIAITQASISTEKANSASLNKDATDDNVETTNLLKGQVESIKTDVLSAEQRINDAEQRVITLMSTDTRSYFFATLADRDNFGGLRDCDRCSVLETRADYIYDVHDRDGDELNPEWIKTSDWDALKTVAWDIISGKPDFSDVALSGSYYDLIDKPNRYESFITLSNENWDYTLSDKAIIILSSNKNINITNVYNGAVGYIEVFGGYELVLPENSKKSIDFDYVTVSGGQHYQYTFIYDGIDFHWSRTVCG